MVTLIFTMYFGRLFSQPNQFNGLPIDPENQNVLTPDEVDTLTPLFKSRDREKDFFSVFLDVLKLNEWFSDEILVQEFEGPLMRLCGQYLYLVKRRGYAMDPVGKPIEISKYWVNLFMS